MTKKKVKLISTKYHSSKINSARRSCGVTKDVVQMPNMVKNYRNLKVGVDVGDQGLRDRRAFADHIRSCGWNRKWGIHAIQQKHHQGYLCWADLHELETGWKEHSIREWAYKVVILPWTNQADSQIQQKEQTLKRNLNGQTKLYIIRS